VDELVRRVAVRQQMRMDAPELIRWADDLRSAPPVPPDWRGTPVETSLADQADLANALAPLRVEFDDHQWAELARRLERGDELNAAAQAVRESLR
jgi:hypothetical protein